MTIQSVNFSVSSQNSGACSKPETTFEDLWRASEASVRAYVHVLVKSSHDTDEVLQETAIAVLADFKKYDRSRSFTEWVIGYARFRTLKHFRRKGIDRNTILAADT